MQMIRSLKSLVLVAVLAAAMALCACAQVSLTTVCPASSTGVQFALAGSTVGNTLISMLSTAATTAGVLPMTGARAAGAPATTNATMTYTYVPIFGADSGSLTCTQAPQNTTVVTSPPAAIVR
jgi:hypothetical protein